MHAQKFERLLPSSLYVTLITSQFPETMKEFTVLAWDPWTKISLYKQSFLDMKSKSNKWNFSALLSSRDTIINSKSDGNYNHDDAITSFVLQAAMDGYKVIRILSIDIFVLVDWMFKAKMKTVIQLKNLEREVLLINATYRA